MGILLSDVVAQVESSNNPLSMRYEPGYQPSVRGMRLVADLAVNGFMDQITAGVICKTSWGAYQIMGDNLYDMMDYRFTLFSFLSSPQKQLDIFTAFVQRGKFGFANPAFTQLTNAELSAFAEYYNGSVVYAESLQKAYREMGA